MTQAIKKPKLDHQDPVVSMDQADISKAPQEPEEWNIPRTKDPKSKDIEDIPIYMKTTRFGIVLQNTKGPKLPVGLVTGPLSPNSLKEDKDQGSTTKLEDQGPKEEI